MWLINHPCHTGGLFRRTRQADWLTTLCLLLSLFLSFNLYAQEVSIVATVNGKPITSFDVESRIRLLRLTENPSGDIKKIALDDLINEILWQEKAAELGVVATDADYALAISDLENKNNIPTGQFEQAMLKKGMDLSDMKKQVYGQILWQKLVGAEVTPKIIISDEEIDDSVTKIASAQQGGGINISEIVLHLDKENSKNADLIMDDLKKGASFADIARGYSIGSTAKEGGVIGWVKEDNLDETLQKYTAGAIEGTIIGPIQGGNSLRIIRINERRSEVLDTSRYDRGRVKEMLIMKKISKAADDYLADLKKQALLEYK
jgi:peptidyl-prolyl cis-trans isomerase SurA